jgi:hypothetical protein
MLSFRFTRRFPLPLKLSLFLLIFACYHKLSGIHRQLSSKNGLTDTPSQSSECSPCFYVSSLMHVSSSINVITMTITSGYGRTGNYFIAMGNAMRRAHECKAMLRLPGNTSDNAFIPLGSVFDFTSRRGSAHPECNNSGIGKGLHGDARLFFHLEALSRASSPVVDEFYTNYAPEMQVIHACLRLYIGSCDPTYCAAHGHLKNKLVAHIRQGDLYPKNFTMPSNRGYGQPPLGYYLSAFGARDWDEVIVVAEPSNWGPIAHLLHILAQANVSRAPVRFQMGEWSDDLRTLMCAANIVESSSTIHDLLVLGRSEIYYSYRCFPNEYKDRKVYKIPITGVYAPFKQSSNSMEEWLDILFHGTGPSLLCEPNSRPEVLNTVDWWLGRNGLH